MTAFLAHIETNLSSILPGEIGNLEPTEPLLQDETIPRHCQDCPLYHLSLRLIRIEEANTLPQSPDTMLEHLEVLIDAT